MHAVLANWEVLPKYNSYGSLRFWTYILLAVILSDLCGFAFSQRGKDWVK